MLRVEDTGPGLDDGDRERAFERFYLHERYGRERPVGTGLGLAIVKELTLAMGGDVDVESRAGHADRLHRAARRAGRRARDTPCVIDVPRRRRARARRLAGRVHRTPTFRLARRSASALKAELFQKTGSFKARGALNRLAALTEEERAARRRHVVGRATTRRRSRGRRARRASTASSRCGRARARSRSRRRAATARRSTSRRRTPPPPTTARCELVEERGPRLRPSALATRSSSPATGRSRSSCSRTCRTLETVVVGVGGGGLVSRHRHGARRPRARRRASSRSASQALQRRASQPAASVPVEHRHDRRRARSAVRRRAPARALPRPASRPCS